jgi:hypothetical protein
VSAKLSPCVIPNKTSAPFPISETIFPLTIIFAAFTLWTITLIKLNMEEYPGFESYFPVLSEGLRTRIPELLTEIIHSLEGTEYANREIYNALRPLIIELYDTELSDFLGSFWESLKSCRRLSVHTIMITLCVQKYENVFGGSLAEIQN